MSIDTSVKPFMVISTYNSNPEYLLQFTDEFRIYDQSDEPGWVERLSEFKNVERRLNCGHSLGNIFEYIVTYWDELPSLIAFTKANVVPRHCDAKYFETIVNSGVYGHLFNEPALQISKGVSALLFPGYYLEDNNSWYSTTKEHSYFCSFDGLASFIFEDYKHSDQILFSPGACFLVERDRIKKYPKQLYEFLFHIVTYRHFPSEAYIVERILPMIFLGSYKINEKFLTAKISDFEFNELKKNEHECLKFGGGIKSKFTRKFSNY